MSTLRTVVSALILTTLVFMLLLLTSCAPLKINHLATMPKHFVGISYEVSDFDFINKMSHRKAVERAKDFCFPRQAILVHKEIFKKPIKWSYEDPKISFIGLVSYQYLQFDCK